ncbi:hypothetical protein [Salinithrix halophila]|uniref:Secreted protein n=1 Tax=Salinithrix halophila TaxID=1485204 RepID=A0ABV8JGD0_9BACL
MKVFEMVPPFLWIGLVVLLIVLVLFLVLQTRKRSGEVDELERAFKAPYDPKSDEHREATLKESKRERQKEAEPEPEKETEPEQKQEQEQPHPLSRRNKGRAGKKKPS